MVIPEPEILQAARKREAWARNWLQLVKLGPDSCARRTAEVDLGIAQARIEAIELAFANVR